MNLTNIEKNLADTIEKEQISWYNRMRRMLEWVLKCKTKKRKTLEKHKLW